MRSCPLHNSPSDAVAKRRYLRDLVRNVPWLAQLPEDDLESLLQGARVHVAEGREWLFRQQTPAHWIYIVVSGAVRLLRATDDGRLATIRCVERGGTLGELSLISQQSTYLYSAEALRRTHVLAISSSRCQDSLAHEHCRGAFLSRLTQELTERLEDMALLTQADARARLVSFLLRQLPLGASLPHAIRLSVPKCWLAAQLAMTPETLSRLLSRLSRAGAILVERHQLVVLDRSKLRALND
ncbi:Crp/Fnr family transcriptional regulator [Modicisalibacter xianhensis]|uniref:cAMP-binding domain of CRP or a regulatory subunit of cAMP-dependent protein kinases n=1 Tax=Modicisalibacter xianhensis TaxID=442341 RepID=A0A1I3DP06_9GAMM|nr:Crp/Fnr family transcriptional regulator [Halomonas xianhensis]SFH88278.1 cAMP-binding domain of CRP or a regulatory subunit of cAMP-dependent protein kinases [Halomonas xianhensis]